MNAEVKENELYKILRSDDFNYNFNKKTGYTETWGANKEEDNDFCKHGNLIADIEVSTICDRGCKFCYKGNTGKGLNMSLETFKTLFHKLPKTLTQIAFGVGNLDANPALKDIIRYCRENNYQEIIPKITINEEKLSEEWAQYLFFYCGAVAISFSNEKSCFESIKLLQLKGMKQCNIHYVLHNDSWQQAIELIQKVKDKVINPNALVFLMLKQKGRGTTLKPITDENYKTFINVLLSSGISYGWDSCGGARLLEYVKDQETIDCITKCESSLESGYWNVEGKFFPCSFTEGTEGWETGLEIKDDFYKDVWFAPRTINWRNKLLKNCRNCPIYKI